MGYRKGWDKADIEQQIYAIYQTCASPYNDGYTGFFAKRDLLELKFLIDDMLERTPKFVGEEEIYQERMLKKLKQ